MAKLQDELEERLAALEARNAALEQQNAALEARIVKVEPKPKPQPSLVQMQPVITFGAPRAHVPDGAMPNDSELTRLRDIVWGKYPILVPRAISSVEFDTDFRRAFSWLLTVGRREALNTAYTVGYWGAKAARMHGQHDINLKAFCTAVVAVGDCAYSTFDDLPHGLAFGLVDVERSPGADLSAGWRKVLSTGQVLKPESVYSPGVLRMSWT